VLGIVATLVLAACGQTATTSAPTTAPVAATAAPAPTTAEAPTAAPVPTPAEAPTAAAEPTAAAAPSGSGTVKIGILAPITGPAASIGQEQLNFGKLALEDFNKANGTSYELVEGDTQLDPAKATDAAQRFAADNDLYVIVGPAGSQEVLAVAPVLGKAN